MRLIAWYSVTYGLLPGPCVGAGQAGSFAPGQQPMINRRLRVWGRPYSTSSTLSLLCKSNYQPLIGNKTGLTRGKYEPTDRVTELSELANQSIKVVYTLGVHQPVRLLQSKGSWAKLLDKRSARVQDGLILLIILAYMCMSRRMGLARRRHVEKVYIRQMPCKIAVDEGTNALLAQVDLGKVASVGSARMSVVVDGDHNLVAKEPLS